MAQSHRRALVAVSSLAVLAGIGLTAGTTSASAAPGPVPVIAADPTTTPAGPAPVEPYLVDGRLDSSQFADRVIVDGALRVPVAGRKTLLLGKQGSDYIVVVPDKLLRVSPDGTTRRLARGVEVPDAVLSDDGRFAAVNERGRKATKPRAVRVINTRTGKVVANRAFTGSPVVLAVDRTQVVVARGDRGTVRGGETVRWDRQKNRVTRITKHRGSVADMGANRLAVQTPFPRSCTIVVKLTNGKQKWRDCNAVAVDSFGPDGSAVTRASDNAYLPTRRDRGGNPVAVYDTSIFVEFGNNLEGLPGYSRWEGDQVLISATANTNGDVRYGLSRCSTTACQPAGPTWSVALQVQ